jgi:hypothetical protein
MIRYASGALVAVGLSAVWLAPGAAQNGGGEWGTIKGRIVWGGAKMPERNKVKVTQDQMHCLSKGALIDNLFEVDSKTRGLKNVFVALKAPPGGKLPIHPTLQKVTQKEVVLDQPLCLFIPRAVAIREGQTLLAKNSAPVQHNIRWTGDPNINKGNSVLIPPMKELPIKGLKAQILPLVLECNIHPWMSGRLAVYNHPYFMVTKADGSFEIKLAPAGEYRLSVYHEGIGWLGGAKGKAGLPVQVKPGGVTDLGELKMGGK